MPQANVKAVITAEDRASKTLSGFGNRVQGVGQKIGTAMKAAAVATGVATAALITYSINQFRDIQKNVAGIQALTKNTNEARKALKNAIDFVQGKPFDRLDTIGATKQLLAFGRTTNQIKGDLKTLGNTVLISGIQWQDVTRVYGRVVASGKLLREDFNILNDAGVGLAKTLQDELGTNMQGVFEKMEDGEISAEIFQKALKKAAPDSAVEKSLNTFDNKLLSLKAKFRDIGFAILGVDFNQLSENGEPLVKEGGLLDKMTDGMDFLTTKLKDVIDWIGKINFSSVISMFKQWFTSVKSNAEQIARGLLPSLKELWSTIQSQVIPTINRLIKDVIVPLNRTLLSVVTDGLKIFIEGLNLLLKMVTPVINVMITFKEVVISLAVALGALKVIGAVQAMLVTLGSGFVAATVRAVGFRAALAALVTAINPVTAVITAAALAAGLLSHALNSNAEKAIAAMEAQGAFSDKLAENAATTYKEAKEAYQNLANAALNYLDVTKQLTSAENAVKVARKALADVTKKYGKNSQEARNAQASLAEQEAKVAQMHSERTNKIKELRQWVIKMTESSGALKSSTQAEIAANLKGAVAIRAQMRARGEDTHQIDVLIGALKKVHKIKKVDIDTKANTNSANKKLQRLREQIEELTRPRFVNISVRSPSGGGRFVKRGYAKNQTGTDFFSGGRSLVGERGPEIVDLPRGSKVLPNDKTEKVMKKSQPNVSITIQAGAFMGSQQDARKYAEMIFRAYSDLVKANPSKAVL